MADQSEVTATCPFCRRPQTIPPSAGRVVCRHCQNAFAWDKKTASAIILPPLSVTGNKRPQPDKRQAPWPTPKTFPSKITILILILLLALAGGGASAYFYLQSPEKPYFPDNLDPASVLEEVGKQLKAITE